MEKKELKAEILFRLEDYNGSRKEAERLLSKYAQEVRKEMFTKEELDLTLATMRLMKLESGMKDKDMDNVIKKLTELLNLEEKGK